MILKWIDSAERWHLVDNISNLTFRGKTTLDEAVAEARKFHGEETGMGHVVIMYEFHTLRDEDQVMFFSGIINNEHAFFVLASKPNQLYVLSDEGKTVDRF